MHPNPPRGSVGSAPARSIFVTVLAWTIIVLSGLLIPIGVITLLMILVGSEGTSRFDPVGFLGIVIAPPASLAGGIGLLRRRVWARYYVIGLLGLIFALNAWGLISADRETTRYTSNTGVKTTVVTSYGSEVHQLPIMAVCALLVVRLFRRSTRDEFAVFGNAGAPAGPGRFSAPPAMPQISTEPVGRLGVCGPPEEPRASGITPPTKNNRDRDS